MQRPREQFSTLRRLHLPELPNEDSSRNPSTYSLTSGPNCSSKPPTSEPEEPTAAPQPSDFWSHINSETLPTLTKIYSEIVHWKTVLYTISKNKTGFDFTDTMNTVLSGTLDRSEKAEILARSKDGNDGSITKTIGRRLDQWLNGNFMDLFLEAKALQDRLPKKSKKDHDEYKEFDKYMTTGRISSAIRCLSEDVKGGNLSTTEKITVDGKTRTVLDILHEKHPKSQPCNPAFIEQDPSNALPYHPQIFERINAACIRKSAMKTNGSHGPSGLDSQEWRRLLTSFKDSSSDLCNTIAKLAIRISTEKLPFLKAYNACRLIAFDKCPGVRPIGIGEVLRRIIGRSIMKCIKLDLALLGNNTQMCLGQKCGIENTIHALRKAYESPEVEGILLIDAQNAFNSLNRELTLKNIDKLCPSLSQAIRNSYSTPSDLYIKRSTVKSQEGTTQGDPLAMAMHGIAILPLIKRVMSDNVTQKWYADDGNAA